MGKMRMGILDGFIGKVGTVVGSFWKGKKVMRGYNEFPANPRSASQELQRVKFGLLGAMGGEMLAALHIGLREYAAKLVSTEVGEFVKLNLPQVSGTASNPTVAYEGLTVSKGHLTGVGFDEPDLENPLQIMVSISESYDSDPEAHADDVVYVAVYNKTLGRGCLSDGSTCRVDDSVKITVPSYWQGTQVEMWGFVATADGSQSSETSYLGSGTIA